MNERIRPEQMAQPSGPDRIKHSRFQIHLNRSRYIFLVAGFLKVDVEFRGLKIVAGGDFAFVVETVFLQRRVRNHEHRSCPSRFFAMWTHLQDILPKSRT